MSPLLVPSYFADLNRFCIPSPIVPGPPPGYTPSSTRRILLERVRAPHHPAFSNAFAVDRALDHRRGRGRNQHRIPRRQLPRRLFFPRQGCEGRLARRNPADLAQRNYFGGTGARALPRARSAHRAPQRRRDWRGSGNRALRIPARRRRKAVAPPAFFLAKPSFASAIFRGCPRRLASFFQFLAGLPFQVSCSLTAETGRISRGSSAPQRRPRLYFFSGFFPPPDLVLACLFFSSPVFFLQCFPLNFPLPDSFFERRSLKIAGLRRRERGATGRYLLAALSHGAGDFHSRFGRPWRY